MKKSQYTFQQFYGEIRSGYKTATFKTATVTKQRHHKTATVTKQRQLQNSDYYKTATTAKKNILIYSTTKNIMLFISLIYFDIFNKNKFVIFLQNR